jgi:uncharacterized damage-inducible protein DinB
MDSSRAFVAKSRSLLAEYQVKIERSIEPLNDEDIWWRPNARSNSAGNLILHLCGNVTQWIVGGVGKLPYERNRPQEFDERRPIPKRELLETLRRVAGSADAVLRELESDALADRRRIQGYDVSVLEAIYHVVEHFSMHTGQIILLSKARTGVDLQLWRPPTP